eukprot:15468625-Alexandrium_andersonii.AAC.1
MSQASLATSRSKTEACGGIAVRKTSLARALGPPAEGCLARSGVGTVEAAEPTQRCGHCQSH